jgi:probable F420-dependent oxidoreductase
MAEIDRPLHLGLKLAQDAPISSFRTVWSMADDAGFRHCWGFDHLTSVGPIGADRPVFDGWMLLAAMAVATRRARMGLLVTGVTYRNPGMLAKLAVTVDHLSGGRLEFGVGAGWAVEEHRMFGIEGTDHRIGRLSEALTLIKMLWSEDVSDFAGRYYTLSGAISNPKPLQDPHPPIWIGGAGPLVMKLVARHADVWNLVGPAGVTPPNELVREASDRLEDACASLGRDPTAIRRSIQLRFDGGDPQPLLDDVHRFYDVGFTEIIVYIGGDEPVQAAAAVAERVLPEALKLNTV